ncbi:MAG: molecular chaperone [Pseudomonadota bacterium]
MKNLINKIFLGLLAIFAATPAIAMGVAPVVIDMKSNGRGARSEITASNTSASPLPIVVSVSEATISSTGEVTTTPIEDQFMIYPAQAIVGAGGVQRFRVQWIGDPDMQRGRTFIFSVAQQPVALTPGTSGIQILYNFETVVSVSPASAQPNLVLANSSFQSVAGKRRANLTLSNPSAAVAYLSGARVTLQSKDAGGRVVWSKTFEPNEIMQNIGVGIVSPGTSRQFTLPFDLPEGGETLNANIRYYGRQ